MVLNDQIKDARNRADELYRCLNIAQKRIDLQNEEERTQEPNFWDNPDSARQQLQKVATIKSWIEDYERIAALRLDELRVPLKEKRIDLSYDEAALKAIAKKSHGNKGGARDLVRVIRKDIEDKVCELIVDNADRKLEGIFVSAENGEITVKESFKTPELEA